MPSKLSNPILQQAEDQIERNLAPEFRDDYDKIVVAGGHLATANGGAMLMQMAKARDPIAGAARGAFGLVLIMQKQAKGVMPEKAAIPASATLMFQALDFLDRSKIVKIGEPELARAVHLWTDYVFARRHITKQGLADAAQKVHAITQDPSAMHAIQLKAGLLKHPMSAQPTPGLQPGPGGMINGPAPGG
jgi:hypothetical protein